MMRRASVVVSVSRKKARKPSWERAKRTTPAGRTKNLPHFPRETATYGGQPTGNQTRPSSGSCLQTQAQEMSRVGIVATTSPTGAGRHNLPLYAPTNANVVIRRRPARPPAPWRPRVDRALEMIRRNDDGPMTRARLAEVDEALERSRDDRSRLQQALGELDAERAARELKAALRARPDPSAPDSATILTLRRRYESIHALGNRLDELDRRVEITIADLEALAAAAVDLSFLGPGSATELESLLETLRLDSAALAVAHEEVAAL